MGDITLSKAVRSNLQSLQSTTKLLSQTQERLSSGLKVNSALDNPTNFFTASSLNSRAGDLGTLLDSVGGAVQTLEAADNGIQALTKLVESAQATARQAQQTAAGITGGTEVAATFTATTAALSADAAATFTATTAALSNDAVATSTGSADISALSATGGVITVNGENVTVGASDNGAAVRDAINTVTGTTGVTASLDVSNQLVLTSADADTDITLGGDATTLTEIGYAGGGTVGSATNLLSQGFSASETLTFDVGGAGAQTITFGTNDGANEVSTIAELNSALSGLTGVTASVDTSGNLTFTADAGDQDVVLGGTADVTALGATAGTTAATNLLSQGFAQGETLTFDVGGAGAETITFGTDGGAGEVSTIAELNTALSGLTGITASVDGTGNLTFTATATDEDVVVGGTADETILGAADGTTAATVTGGTNRREELENDYNELLTQIDQLTADAGFNGKNLLNGDDLKVTFNEDASSSLTISGVSFDSAGLGLSAVSTGDFATDTNIESTISTLDGAISSLRSQASKFGSNLSVVETRENFTNAMIDTLETGAANLTLADTNEEGANLLALQTRQSLSSTTLSLASQADQNVLRLL